MKGGKTMTASRSVSIGMLLLLSCAMLALFFGRPSAGQPPAPAPREVGRYQMVVEKSFVYVCDTQTGQVWYRVPTLTGPDKWIQIASPVVKEKK
jgi:hypothetical protein